MLSSVAVCTFGEGQGRMTSPYTSLSSLLGASWFRTFSDHTASSTLWCMMSSRVLGTHLIMFSIAGNNGLQHFKLDRSFTWCGNYPRQLIDAFWPYQNEPTEAARRTNPGPWLPAAAHPLDKRLRKALFCSVSLVLRFIFRQRECRMVCLVKAEYGSIQ